LDGIDSDGGTPKLEGPAVAFSKGDARGQDHGCVGESDGLDLPREGDIGGVGWIAAPITTIQ